MNCEDELHEGLKKIHWLYKKLSSKQTGLDEQVAELDEQISELRAKTTSAPTKDERIQILARLCLLSELAGAISFDRMIQAREKFLDMYPEHFREYLAHLDSASWQITWSGCLGCLHFAGKCALNVTPIEMPSSDDRLRRICPSREKKSANL